MRNAWKVNTWLGRAGRWVAVVAVPLSLSLSLCVASAEEPKNLVKNGDAEAGTLDNWKDYSNSTTVVLEGAHSGKACFSCRKGKHTTFEGGELIPIDPSKTYVLSGWVKSAGNVKGRLYFGYIPYGADKKPIETRYVTAMPGTETTLVEGCNQLETVLKVAKAEGWRVGDYVAFDVDDSGKYADLPNKRLSPPIAKVEKKGDVWEVELRDKCGFDFPAGTKVRQHVSPGSYVYSVAANVTVPLEWTQYTVTIKGLALSGYPPTQWGPGIKYIRIIIIPEGAQGDTIELLLDDISLMVSDK